MKFVKYLALLATVALLLSPAALAKDTHSGKFTLDSPARVGHKQLKAGHYKAEWTGPDNNLRVSILENGKTVARAKGRIMDLKHPSPYDAVDTWTLPNNSRRIEEIDFSNRSEALVLSAL